MRVLRRVMFVVVASALLAHGAASAESDGDGIGIAPNGAFNMNGEQVVSRFRVDEEELRTAFELPFSAGWPGREERFLNDWKKRVEDLAARRGENTKFHFTPADVDLALLRVEIVHRLAQIPLRAKRRDEVLLLAPFATDLAQLEEGRRRLENLAPKDAATRLDDARRAVEAVKTKVEKAHGKKAEESATPAARPRELVEGTVPADGLATTATVAARAAHQIGALKDSLRGWFNDRDGYEPEFGWWCRKPFGALETSLDEYVKLLRDKVSGGGDALVGDPIGADALAVELAHELVPYTPEEILAIADREYAWCESEAKKCAQEMGLGSDWKKALAKVKQDIVDPGRQDELVAAQSREAIEFVRSRDLLTLPDLCCEVWRLEMISESSQKTMPYAYYSGQKMGVAFPTEGMDHDRKMQVMRGNNVHFSRIVTPHELIPGHHLQLHQAARHAAYREVFRTPFLVEGWALYWEMRLWDLGWGKTPEDRLGMLFWRMHRCARITVTLNFHLGKMTPQQMIDHLVERVGHETDGATAEVRRYIAGHYGPLYQVAYMLGGLQLRALHRELVVEGKHGRNWTEKEFHDSVLRENSIPVRMVRAALLMEKDVAFGPAPWRFAD